MDGIIPPLDQHVLREVQIDVLSTLGATTAALLVENNPFVRIWPEENQDRLARFALLREASAYKARFPELERDTPLPEVLSVQPLPGELPTHLLPKTVTSYPGEIPVLITVPHDGRITSIDGHDLVPSPSKNRDGATRIIATETRAFLSESDEPQPAVLIDNVHRACRTPQTRAYFEGVTFRALGELLQQTATGQPVVHFDLHGFSPRPGFDVMQHDLVLGTGHRTTVGAFSTDHQFADFMDSRGYSVYVPSEKRMEDECFTADSPATLVQRVRSLGFPFFSSIQIEINKRFRIQGAQEIGRRLSHDLGAFAVAYGKSVSSC